MPNIVFNLSEIIKFETKFSFIINNQLYGRIGSFQPIKSIFEYVLYKTEHKRVLRTRITNHRKHP